MPCHERGLALVTVLMLLALLLVLALVLTDKVLRATRGVTVAGAREQALQAAGAGIEWARHRLAATYRDSSGWAAYLAGSPGNERYSGTPAFSTAVGGVTVDIFLRDNPDGDANPRRDNDLKVFVLARARTANGPEVLVESLCGLDPEASTYRQAGADAGRSGQVATDGLAEPWAAPVTSFQLTD